MFRVILFILLMSITIVSCKGVSPHPPHQSELRAAFEHNREVLEEARLSLDTSGLSEVFTEESSPEIIEALKAAEGTTFRGEDIDVEWLRVLEYDPPEAIIEVKYFYRPFTFNRETGRITYESEPRRYWRIYRYRMLQEDGVWKVDRGLEFVDWSG